MFGDGNGTYEYHTIFLDIVTNEFIMIYINDTEKLAACEINC